MLRPAISFYHLDQLRKVRSINNLVCVDRLVDAYSSIWRISILLLGNGDAYDVLRLVRFRWQLVNTKGLSWWIISSLAFSKAPELTIIFTEDKEKLKRYIHLVNFDSITAWIFGVITYVYGIICFSSFFSIDRVSL